MIKVCREVAQTISDFTPKCFYLHCFVFFFQIQQTMYRRQRQEKSVPILQTEEVLQGRHEERR